MEFLSLVHPKDKQKGKTHELSMVYPLQAEYSLCQTHVSENLNKLI